MKKRQKQEIQEFIKILKTAHEKIEGAVHTGDGSLIRALLNICQESVIELGTMIEKLEGEGHAVISCLEEYCELLYQISDGWNRGVLSENQVNKLLDRQTGQIENIVKKKIAVRKEVVFFPYKASMWDSLESVYLAEKSDPHCDVYCVPVPYYDRNPDHSFGQMHYEGDQYPEYVEVTDWRTYSPEERMPDEIYIHNAYDNWNLVTSVHPRYYAGNLKQYTEKLVYIPYFVLDEVEPDDVTAVESMKHFCFMPGIIYADKVILQSEKMRQIYISEYIKAAREHGLADSLTRREYVEQKFLGTGSPKIDRVVHTKKEDLDIPDQWMEIIRKPDHTWKKIVFYNTGITALLSHNEKWVDKIESVLNIFKQKRNEIALLWRPHPLIESTMKSMRPGILTKYLDLKHKYQTEGWGIFDQTADVDRAVVLSDAYYGDGSSVVQLYKKTGNPIMIQETEAVGESGPAMYNGVRNGDSWWFVSIKDNILYNMDLGTYKLRLVRHMLHKDEAHLGKLAYSKLISYKDKLVLIPDLSRYIAVYHITEEKVTYVPFESGGIAEGQFFNGGVVLEDTLFFIPCQYDKILAFHLDSEKIETDRCIPLPCFEKKYKDIFSWGGFVQEEETVLFTSLTQNKIYRVNLKTKEISDFTAMDEPLAGIIGTGHNYFIFPAKGDRIIMTDRNGKTVRVITGFPPDYQSGEWSFHGQIDLGDEMILLPRLANQLLRINPATGEIHEIVMDDSGYDAGNFWDHYERYAAVIACGQKKIVVETKTGVWNILNENYELSVRKRPETEGAESGIRQLFQERRQGDIVNETEGKFINIHNFIKYAVLN